MRKILIIISMMTLATTAFSETCKRQVNNTKATITASIVNDIVKMKYSQITNGIPSFLKLKDMEAHASTDPKKTGERIKIEIALNAIT